MSSCRVRPGPHLEPALLGTPNPTDRRGHQDQGSLGPLYKPGKPCPQTVGSGPLGRRSPGPASPLMGKGRAVGQLAGSRPEDRQEPPRGSRWPVLHPVGLAPRTLAVTPSKSRSALDSSHCILCLTSTLCPQPPRPAASQRHAEACWPPGLPPLPTDLPHPLSL